MMSVLLLLLLLLLVVVAVGCDGWRVAVVRVVASRWQLWAVMVGGCFFLHVANVCADQLVAQRYRSLAARDW